MFAYCVNNPVSLSDNTGSFATAAAYKNQTCYEDTLCGGSGGAIIAAVIIGGAIIGATAAATAKALSAISSGVYAFAKAYVDASSSKYADHQPRVHHIIPKGKFRWYGPEIVGMMDEMHQMLIDAKIDINDPENLIIVSHGSHKSMHTKGYIIQIYNIMKQAENGGRDAVLEALDYARSYVASLDKYANGW